MGEWQDVTIRCIGRFNVVVLPSCLPPLHARCSAKVLAEWQAWAIASQQERWRLVAICPGNTYGPPMAINPNSGA